MNTSDVTFSYPIQKSTDYTTETFKRVDISKVKEYVLSQLKTEEAHSAFYSKQKTGLPLTFFTTADKKIVLIGKRKAIYGKNKKLRFAYMIDLKNEHEEKVACLKSQTNKDAVSELKNILLLQAWKVDGIVQTIATHTYNSPKNIIKTLMVQEFCSGSDLAVEVSRKLFISGVYGFTFKKQLYSYFMQISKTLSLIHKKKYVYHDIKLENFLLKNDQCLLVDFSSIVPSGSISGFHTKYYLPPEILLCRMNETSDWENKLYIKQSNIPAWDIWCLGEAFFGAFYGYYTPSAVRITEKFHDASNFINYCDYTEEKDLQLEYYKKCFPEIRKEFIEKLYSDDVETETLTPDNINELIAMMQHFYPKKRPTADFIAETLEKMHDKMS